MRAVEDVFVSFGLGDRRGGNMAAQFFVEKLKGFSRRRKGVGGNLDDLGEVSLMMKGLTGVFFGK